MRGLHRLTLLGALALAAAACTPSAIGASTAASTATAASSSLPAVDQRKAAPALDGATSWLDVDHPLTLAELKGRVVVVDFWTSGCINCIHTLATLKKVEERFAGQPVVVIGIHSPKFDAEGESARLASTLEAYDLHHPVAVDGKHALWDRWGAEAWPTVMVLDTEGRIVTKGSGEPDLERLSRTIKDALAEGGDRLARGSLPGIVTAKDDPAPLRFPGKVSTLGDGRLAITDTGHHRIVITKADGSTEAVIGNGLAGALDGSFAECSFSAPQGTSYANGILYVADTENHTIRAANLQTRAVTTIAGTGVIGHGSLGGTDEPARTTALRSPWDLLAKNGRLYVALAGSHQIAVLDLATQSIHRFAGSGREALTDGTAEASAFAQPSGLATDGQSLFVADPESSAIRRVDLASGTTTTLVGKGLFDFGDVDGDPKTARLQHALGVAVVGRTLYVVDTYNSKLKAIDLDTHRLSTVLGGADRVQLYEPGGITVDRDRLVIADTHHGRVVSVPIAARGTEVSPVALSGLTAPTRGVAIATASAPVTLDPKAPELRLAWRVADRAPATVRIAWQLPAGTGINEDAPAALRWVSAKGLERTPENMKLHGKDIASGVPIQVALTADEATLDGVLDVVTCDVATHRVCIPLRRNVRATITRGPSQLVAEAALPAAK